MYVSHAPLDRFLPNEHVNRLPPSLSEQLDAYLVKTLGIQPLKHIQKVNLDVKLESTPGT